MWRPWKKRRGVRERERGIERDERVQLVDLAAGELLDVDVRPRTVADVLEVAADHGVLNVRPFAWQVCNLLGVDRRRQWNESAVQFLGPAEDTPQPSEQFLAQLGGGLTGGCLDLQQRLDELPFCALCRVDQPCWLGQISLVVDDPVLDFDAPSEWFCFWHGQVWRLCSG